ncbi:MAG: rod shape-determining protein MreC [Acetobacteraceae bacterium]|nr:rod shape-determining protein MreC [Acetobacteraceae bacterium]
MIRPSIQARHALARLTLPAMVVAAFGLMLVGKVDTVLVERARTAVYDMSAPVYAVLAEPLRRINKAIAEIVGLWGLRDENARLRVENEQLRRWQSIALTLDSENQRLKTALRWIPDPEASYVTARVVADAGGVYAKAVLLSVGPRHALRKGQIALDERGLVGRITELGSRTARVLLITDMNSRVPVILETSRARAIMAGTNGPWPRLQYWTEGTIPKEGERVVTTAEANAFPANLPVGTIRYNANGIPEIEPDAQLRVLDVVRIFDYGLGGFAPPETPSRPTPGRR